ncbi:MAG: DMT family transporter [Desulfobulbaceae bacterium]|nr:DMT family transporter [Desulfobulbaceae bacterium]HIJ79031.1 DMT family transporter [Deltaproteobacteria bacterium]
MAIILMLLASASFATMAALIKGIGPEVPLSQLIFLRCWLALPVLLGVLVAKGMPVMIRARQVLIWRTALGMAAMHCFFYALTHMPLADAVFIGRAQPLLLALLAPVMIGEHAPKSAWLAIGTGLVGVALIMNPSLHWSLAAWVALAGAAFSAGAHLLVRRLNRTDAPLVIVFNFLVLTGLVTSTWVVPSFVAMSAGQWLFTGGVALFASLGQLLMTEAYRRDRAPAVAAAAYSSVILSVLYGYLFWGELPLPIAFGGAGLIVAGGLLLVLVRWRVSEPAEQK